MLQCCLGCPWTLSRARCVIAYHRVCGVRARRRAPRCYALCSTFWIVCVRLSPSSGAVAPARAPLGRCCVDCTMCPQGPSSWMVRRLAFSVLRCWVALSLYWGWFCDCVLPQAWTFATWIPSGFGATLGWCRRCVNELAAHLALDRCQVNVLWPHPPPPRTPIALPPSCLHRNRCYSHAP